MKLEPTETAVIIRPWRWTVRDYQVTQTLAGGPVIDIVRAGSAFRALLDTDLIPGAKVTVCIPIIVHARRAPKGKP